MVVFEVGGKTLYPIFIVFFQMYPKISKKNPPFFRHAPNGSKWSVIIGFTGGTNMACKLINGDVPETIGDVARNRQI